MLNQDLAQIPLFQGFSDEQLSVLEPLLEFCHFPAGHVIFEQGARADALCILISGAVEVRYKPYDGPILVVAKIPPGGVFGWSAALGRETYTSAAVASEPVEAYRMNARKFRCLCDQYPETGVVLLERLASIIAERMSSTHEQILAVLQTGMDRCEEPRRRKK